MACLQIGRYTTTQREYQVNPENTSSGAMTSRRATILGGLSAMAAAAAASLPSTATAAGASPAMPHPGATDMDSGFVTVKDGTQIFYKDWGPKDGPVVWFHHGWPLTA